MQKIMITSDSTCDLSPEQIKAHNIHILPLAVITDDEHLDGVDLLPKDIFDYVAATKKLPKTAARGTQDFVDFFENCLKSAENIIHIGIGSELSGSYRNACAAAEQFEGRVKVIDGNTLSTGTGLLVLYAAELAEVGKPLDQIVALVSERTHFVQASFVVDTLEYLYRGGRCSALSMLGANLLKIKPRLQLVDGKITVAGKYMGKMLPVLKKYVDETFVKYPHPDKKRCFVTHASADSEIVKQIVEYVKSKNIFDEVVDTVAGSTITSHCGQGTLGILYFNDGDKR